MHHFVRILILTYKCINEFNRFFFTGKIVKICHFSSYIFTIYPVNVRLHSRNHLSALTLCRSWLLMLWYLKVSAEVAVTYGSDGPQQRLAVCTCVGVLDINIECKCSLKFWYVSSHKVFSRNSENKVSHLNNTGEA